MLLLKVAICDDVHNEREKIKTALKIYEEAHPEICFDTDEYHTSLDILHALEKEKIYDVALLDICMPGILGTNVAEEMLAKTPDTSVIFLTTSDEYAVEAFAMNATHYLLKPFTQKQFDAAIDRAARKMPGEALLSLSCVDGIYRVRISEVVSIESQGHYLLYHLSSGETLRQRGKLVQIYDELQGRPEFIRIGASYIVNLIFVRKVSANTVELSNGKIPVPRRSSGEVRRAYMDFCRRRCNERAVPDSGIASHGIVPCDCHLSYARMSLRKKKIYALQLPVYRQLSLHGRVRICGRRDTRHHHVCRNCRMPVSFFLPCLAGMLFQEVLFVSYLFLPLFRPG